MGVALRTMDFEENHAVTLARGCGRSLAALARLIPSGAYEPPAWLGKGQDLLPAILAGAWDTSNQLDRRIVEQIAGGTPCAEIERRISAFLRDDDPPFDREGTIWKARAPMDAFVRVGHLIGQGEAELLRAALATVFSAIEPGSRFAPAERAQAIAALDETLAYLDQEERKGLWAELRNEVGRHERFKDAAWALPEEELAPLRAIAEKYAPEDPVANLVMMFDGEYSDETFNRAQGGQRRSAALKQLYADGGADAVLRLVSGVRAPYSIVEAAAGAGFTEAQIEELLSRSAARDPDTGFTVNLAALYRNVFGAERAEAWLQKTADKTASPDVTARLCRDGLMGSTWRTIRRFGPDVMRACWKQRWPRYLKGSRRELLEALLMLLRYGRAVEAIQSSLNRLPEVPTKLAFRMLDGVIPQLKVRAAPADTSNAFYIEKLLEALDRRPDVSDEQIAIREFGLLPLLERGGRQLRIYGLMAADPGFFHAILRNVYLGKSEEWREVDTETHAKARLSYSLLSHFSLLPGQTGNAVDATALTAWIDEVRCLGAETDRAEITDSYVGRVLAHAPADLHGGWPHRVVRDEIERLSSDNVERAVQLEWFNMRGVRSRGIYEGGDQERDFAKASYDAAELSTAWPRTSALLRAIGKMWEEDAKRADLDAAQRRVKS